MRNSLRRWFLLLPLLVGCKSKTIAQDPYLWLEEVEGKKALEFAQTENKKTLEHFQKNPHFKKIEKEARAILLAEDRTPAVSLRKGELYNFWRDQKNVRGVWRKTSISSYKTKHPKWDILLDIDELAKKENENWVWSGASTLGPRHDRALVSLSRGGKDAVVVREFDLNTRQFVKDGFYVPEAKTHISWKDENTVFVGTDFGAGSLTDSGYPRIVKVWKRGTPLSKAVTVQEASPKDMSAYSYIIDENDKRYVFHSIRKGFYSSTNWYEDKNGNKTRLPMPEDSEFWGVFSDKLFFELKSDLGSFKSGSIVFMPLNALSQGEAAQKTLRALFVPTDKRFIQGMSPTKNHILLHVTDNVLSRIEKVTFTSADTWTTEVVKLGENGVSSVTSTEEESDNYLAQYVDFLTPNSLYLGNASDKNNHMDLLKKSPERFNSVGLKTERFEATSKDGTKIPYFVVSKKDIKLDGKNPTLLYGYGGFQAPMQPSYLNVIGKVWVEKGGVYVLSNLRGGGEFGPAWHQAVLKENRYKVYEDNIAIAESLIAKGITSPQHLGISGRSNGGLLTGATFTTRPDLFNAAIVGVPLLDMLRYHKLLAGASWMDEYGDPDDPKMREAILKYSPYQRLNKEVKYPEVFIMTSTKDDRVHPGHARKMVARMKEQGHPVFYYENTEGGHAGSANIEQTILWNSLEYSYLWERLQ
ncbi:prolyl oligopeptidase family serine peptidase [Bdellovibrio sp. 22V]|uniref:prolyl oligopeptidase family serine peptidase n=1 Tax=Bdellovibrio sp. 22V TaxID=3044166 RepID=UPI002543A618|nr:prolyl oligopeptidase family serine peptidase [Bdellovibrio sp. 22V]WII72453.1 prolyl oligopeptidase family serine peptidase [Bdellovibrio sp. 22V]